MRCSALFAPSGLPPSMKATRRVFALLLICAVLLAHVQLQQYLYRGTCSDFSFRVPLTNQTANSLWNVTVRAVNPKKHYKNHLTFTYHNDRAMLRLNNAVCKLKLSGVSGMTRTQLQNLKPHIIKQIVIRTRSRHLAYIDWDANFIRWPTPRSSNLIVQSTTGGDAVNTGALFFFESRKHVALLDRWIAFESDTRHDQNSWHEMERNSQVHRQRMLDGAYVEHYNWNCINKRAQVRRCGRVIAETHFLNAVAWVLIVAALATKAFDLYALRVRGYHPRRALLSVALLVALALAVLFTGDVHRQAGDAVPYHSERVCGVPELALLRDGRLVTRRGTVGDANEFVGSLVHIVGVQYAASMLSFWFAILARLRDFARVFVLVELFSVLSMLVTGFRARPESMLWALYVQLSDRVRGSTARKEYIVMQRTGGKAHVGIADKKAAIPMPLSEPWAAEG